MYETRIRCYKTRTIREKKDTSEMEKKLLEIKMSAKRLENNIEENSWNVKCNNKTKKKYERKMSKTQINIADTTFREMSYRLKQN